MSARMSWRLLVMSRLRAAVRSFSFQAEDGIRYLTVTGVQTCALPISRSGAPRRCGGGGGTGARRRGAAAGSFRGLPARELRRRPVERRSGERRARRDRAARSEERRVGKEGRSRGSPYHLKKKNQCQFM